MMYNISFPTGYQGNVETYTAHYADFPEYNLLSIAKESYIVRAIIENSDEGHVYTGRMIHNLQIGRYCSIADDVYFLIGRGKDFTRVSTAYPKVLHMAPNIKSGHREKGSIIIENDVWIGRKAAIMGGVTIHNGAIVAANSHVVKDVPPYAIVGGNPAKVIGYRFSPEIIDRLQRIQWWYWSDEKIQSNAQYFNDDLETFCARFYPEAMAEFEQKYADINENTKDAYFMIVDANDKWSIMEFVINEFASNFYNNEEKELILFALEGQVEDSYYDELSRIICDIQDRISLRSSIILCRGDIEEAKVQLMKSKHLIINRMPCTVELMCFAEKCPHDIEIISGVDSFVF